MDISNLLPGDIIWGMFPCDDGRGFARHAAIVVGSVNNEPLALVGTSQDVPERSGTDRLVLAPRGKVSMDDDWRLTGLAKPTRFDGRGKLFKVRQAKEWCLIGTIRECKQESQNREWTRTFRQVQAVVASEAAKRMRKHHQTRRSA